MTTKKTAPSELTPEEQAAAEAAAGRELRIADLRGRFGDDVTLYPLEGVWVSGVPHEVQTVDVERADELLGYFPPAFTIEAPPAEPETPASGDPPTEPQPSGDAGATPQEA